MGIESVLDQFRNTLLTFFFIRVSTRGSCNRRVLILSMRLSGWGGVFNGEAVWVFFRASFTPERLDS